MQIFPTQHSTLSATALGPHISDLYNLGQLSGRLLLRGVSDTYVLTGTDKKYILKIYRDVHRKKEEILSEVELLNQLRAGGAAVSYPLADRQGQFLLPLQAAEGLRWGVVFTFAEGKPAMFPTAEQLATTGREMAKLHNITSGVKLPYPRKGYDHDTIFRQPVTVLEPAFAEMPDEYRQLQEQADKAIRQLDALGIDQFPTGYIQYDFLPKNFHFDAQDQLTFFDFDFAGRGVIANDLMTYWVHFALHAVLGRQTKEKSDIDFQVFLDAYTAVRPLSDAEIKALPWLHVGFWIFYMAFNYEHFDDFSSQYFNNGFLRERVNIIKKILDVYAV
ncbi:phosphotransferase enzyme family protein [Paraflavitalea pollutisoli]|uniref:phosphotransferase enzyme family protein n=1 Tax=Paraflavitalea pollutisoli TaxID=3034143 RepID=UPI0023EB116F|nr:phosphotransferase [Paraflavitalea sp. H1-2-19X]